MQLSDLTASAGIYEDIDFLLKTNSTDFPNAHKQRLVNQWYRKAAVVVLDNQDDWAFMGSALVTTLTANVMAYPFPSQLFTVDRVEVTHDGTNWYVAKNIGREEWLNSMQSGDINLSLASFEPVYYLEDQANGSAYVNLLPVPTTAISNGLKVYGAMDINPLTASAQVPAFPQHFHQILSKGAAFEYAVSVGDERAAVFKQQADELMMQMAHFYKTRNKNKDMRLKVGDQVII